MSCLPRGSAHPPVRSAQYFLPRRHFKPKTRIKADIVRLVGLQERSLALVIHASTECLDHLAADPSTLPVHLNSDRPEVAMPRLRGVQFRHVQPMPQAPKFPEVGTEHGICYPKLPDYRRPACSRREEAEYTNKPAGLPCGEQALAHDWHPPGKEAVKPFQTMVRVVSEDRLEYWIVAHRLCEQRRGARQLVTAQIPDVDQGS